MSKYQELDVWKISMQLVQEVYKLTKEYPREELYNLTSQTKRAAVSIPSNIAEGIGRNHKKDTIQFLYVARGSLYELQTLLELALMNSVINHNQVEHVSIILVQNLKVLNGFINYMEKSQT